MKIWILLEVNDLVEKGDETWDCRSMEWRPIEPTVMWPSCEKGEPPIRREVKT